MPIQPSCPRCGYDQSGEIARWADPAAPPMPRGTCVECGLEFEWIDVLDPSRHKLPGFFEHTPGLIGFFTSAWRTWWWTVLPWRFWSKVQMHHRVRPRRLAFWLVAMWLLPLFCFVACRGFGRIWHESMQTAPGSFRGAVIVSSSPFETVRRHALAIGTELFWPILEARDVNWVPMMTGAGIQVRKQFSGVLKLFSDYDLPPGMYVTIVTTCMFPFILMILPVTRSEAKVDWRHIWRATSYSTAWLALAMIALMPDLLRWLSNIILTSKPAWVPLGLGRPSGRLYMVETLLSARNSTCIVLWLLLWWYIAISKGFQFRRPVLVWLAAAIPTLLGVVIVHVLCYGFGL